MAKRPVALMSNGVVFSLLSLAALVAGCKSREFGENGATVQKAFDASETRGRKVIGYTAPNGVAEKCFLPRHFPGVKYPKGDAEDEDELCGLNFYKAPVSPDAGQAVALCPKLSSTFPGVEVYELDGKDKASYETALCKPTIPDPQNRSVEDSIKRPTKRLAKFKQSVSCSFTGSILGYYHLSRILGEANNVPVAVVRTMDVAQHLKIAERGVAWTMPQDPSKASDNHKLWKQVRGYDRSPSDRKNYFSSDLKTIFGALSVNPAGEEKYDGINSNPGAATAKARFLSTAEARRVYQGGSVTSFVRGEFNNAAQTMQQMKDISDMVVMDYVFQQQDRFGNIHFQNYWYWQDASGEVQTKRAKDPATAPDPGAVVVKRMLFKDNDCGGRVGDQRAFTVDDVTNMRHMSPKTYKRLQFLANQFRSGAATAFFAQEALLDTSDALGTETHITGVSKRVIAAADGLKAQCKAGSLLLDLSLEDHVAKLNTPDAVKKRCDEVHAAEGTTAASGKLIAKTDTWLKHSPTDSASLAAADKCAFKAGLAIGYKTKSTQSGHFELEVDIAPATDVCPAAFFTGAPIYAFADHFVAIEPRECVVASDTANVRTDSNTTGAIVTAFPKGTKFNVEGRKDGWYQVWFDGKPAFVSPTTLEEPCKSAK